MNFTYNYVEISSVRQKNSSILHTLKTSSTGSYDLHRLFSFRNWRIFIARLLFGRVSIADYEPPIVHTYQTRTFNITVIS